MSYFYDNKDLSRGLPGYDTVESLYPTTSLCSIVTQKTMTLKYQTTRSSVS